MCRGRHRAPLRRTIFGGRTIRPPNFGLTRPPAPGIVLGLTPGLKSAFFAADAAFPLVFQTANLAAQPAVTLMNLIMAASLALAIFRLRKARPVVASSSAGAALSPVSGYNQSDPNKSDWEGGGGAEGDGEAEAKKTGLAVEEGRGRGDGAGEEEGEEAPSSQAHARRKALIPITVGVISVRFLIVPTCTVGLYLLALQTSTLRWLVPESSVVRLSLILLSSMPSAQLVLMLTSKLGLHDTNSLLSIAYVVMYLVGIISITGWLSLALALVFG